MPFVSITRLKVKSIVYLIPFLRANEVAIKQLVITPGFLSGKELVDKGLTFWTLTSWSDDAAMKAFRNSVAHRKAMQQLPTWCSEASYFHWVQEQSTLPEWNTAATKLIQEGKITKVRNPSPRQLSNNFPPIQWKKIERVFTAPNNLLQEVVGQAAIVRNTATDRAFLQSHLINKLIAFQSSEKDNIFACSKTDPL